MQLTLSNVSHHYGRRPTLTNLNLSIPEGEIGALIGPSGAGKSTVLNCIAGLEHVSGGTIHVGDNLVSSPTVHLPAEKRRLGLMFQDSALFPHLNVINNVGFGLKGSKIDKKHRIEELLKICHLEELGTARPHELSGGQQQRVALARALAPRPRLLLLDEPFSNSDAVLRASLLNEVNAIIRREGSTALLVTHDQSDAFAIADCCGVIDAGTICQWDTAYNLYHRPNCAFVANFIGDGVMLNGMLTSSSEVDTELGRIRSDVKLVTPLLSPGGTVKVLMRPDDIVLANGSGIPVTVVARSFRGADIYYTLATAKGTNLSAVLPSNNDISLGTTVHIECRVKHVVLFPTIS